MEPLHPSDVRPIRSEAGFRIEISTGDKRRDGLVFGIDQAERVHDVCGVGLRMILKDRDQEMGLLRVHGYVRVAIVLVL